MSARTIHVTSRRLSVLVAVMALSAFGFAAQKAAAQDEDGAGVMISGKATSADVGLPIYPGAKPHKDPGSDSDAARLGLWGGGFGFKLAVMQMESSDAPAKVAEFYRKALAKYGEVLDCTKPGTGHGSSSDGLTCDDDKPSKAGGMAFKVGTKKKQHIVAVDPNGSGTTFALIYLRAKGD